MNDAVGQIPNKEAAAITLPEGKWDVYIDGENAGTTVLNTVEGEIGVAPISAMVLMTHDPSKAEKPDYLNKVLPIAVVGVAAVAMGAVTKKKKEQQK